MAKKGTLDHPKLIALADALDIDQCFALGILEAIWHFTIQYATSGEIGRFSDRAIATGIRTSIKPDKLIKALIQTGWLDEDEECRIRVHDWQDHAYDWVKSKGSGQPRGKPFAAGSDDRRNSNGRPTKLQTNTANETANQEHVSANGTANGTAKNKDDTAKLTASCAGPLLAYTNLNRPPIPSLEEIQEHALEQHSLNGSFASQFFSKNQANNWEQNGQPIRDWKKFFNTWVANLSVIERDQFTHKPEKPNLTAKEVGDIHGWGPED